mmetsp:Transcript_44922/g.104729  ORF Transcript_44922/g.104729 Transcript_44922/m.104729 type:complete len:265 (+) Transcript_44922:599-1393(+)
MSNVGYQKPGGEVDNRRERHRHKHHGLGIGEGFKPGSALLSGSGRCVLQYALQTNVTALAEYLLSSRSVRACGALAAFSFCCFSSPLGKAEAEDHDKDQNQEGYSDHEVLQESPIFRTIDILPEYVSGQRRFRNSNGAALKTLIRSLQPPSKALDSAETILLADELLVLHMGEGHKRTQHLLLLQVQLLKLLQDSVLFSFIQFLRVSSRASLRLLQFLVMCPLCTVYRVLEASQIAPEIADQTDLVHSCLSFRWWGTVCSLQAV